MAENKKEIEVVKKLKDSFPDMLDFNNCLKELREFWKLSQKQDEIKFLEGLEKQYKIGFSNLFPKEIRNQINSRLLKLKELTK